MTPDIPCEKRRYMNVSDARWAHRRMGARLRVYFCTRCGGFHVTNADKAQDSERSADAVQRRRVGDST
jgi:hypothetical protein